MRSQTDVLIAGGGPVGLALALDLSSRGIRSILVEQSDGSPRHPKVGHVSVRTMEHIRRWGLVERLRHCGFPPDYALRMVYCTSMNGYTLCVHEYPSMRDAPTPPETPEKKQRCPQLWFDPILADAIRGYSNCRLEHLAELRTFRVTREGVIASVEAQNGPAEIRARYMAACDGANSSIRERLGIRMQGNPNLSRSVAIYFRAPGLLAGTTQGQGERYTFVGPEGTWGNLTVVDGSELWRLTVFGSHDRIDLDTFDAAGWVRRCLANDRVSFEILSILPWRRTELVAERYSEGPVFLVGDAAHTMSPTGGFGMNTGIGDAVDLAWKLQGALAGWAGAKLLASYSDERRPIGERNARFSATNFYNLVADTDRSAILDEGEKGGAARQKIGTAMKAATLAEYESLGVILGYRYDHSPICISDGSQPPPDPPDRYVPTSRPGARSPHVWLEDGTSILDRFGREFTLASFGALDTSRFSSAAKERGLPFRTLAIQNDAAAAAYERRLVLVRPDGHVAWRGDELPADPGFILDVVRGADPNSRSLASV
ncbi:MAG: FAD-dependent monooxygenase [Xanthobacteraceae bacterium]